MTDAPVPPQNLDAEENVLGAMMLSKGAITVCADIVYADDFYRQSHGIIFRAALDLNAAGEPVDAITLTAELERTGKLKDAGGRTRVHELAALVPASANAGHYARLVADAARRREQVALGIQLREAAMNGGLSEHPEVVERLRTLLAARTSPRDPRDREAIDVATLLETEEETSRAVWGDGPVVAWARGEALMLVGPQGTGKTTVMQQLALARAAHEPTQILGMVVEPDERPVLYIAADRPNQAVRSLRRMVDEPIRIGERMLVWRGPLPFLLTDDKRGQLADFALKYGAGTVFIDSLKDVASKLADDEGGNRVNLAFQEVVAADVELCVGHHPRKASADNKRPDTLDDVYGSTFITAGCGSVLLLWGKPGDPLVELAHLKQPEEEVGPLTVRHDHVHGRSTVQEQVDLEQLLWRAVDGISAPDAAGLVYSTNAPDKNQVERVRRRLEGFVSKGLAQRSDAAPPDPVLYSRRERGA